MNDKRKKNNYLVYGISVAIIILITAMAGIFPKAFGANAQHIYNFISNSFGWSFLLIIFILDIFLISLAISRYGRFKLGSDDEEPEFSFLSWLGMLFSRTRCRYCILGCSNHSHIIFIHLFQKMCQINRPNRTCSHGLYLLSLGISQWSIFAMVDLSWHISNLERSEMV